MPGEVWAGGLDEGEGSSWGRWEAWGGGEAEELQRPEVVAQKSGDSRRSIACARCQTFS